MNAIRRYIELVESIATAPKPEFLYHVTSDLRLPSIKENGLIPQVCKDSEDYGPLRCALYLGNWQDCLDHAEVVEDRIGGNAIYFRVAVSQIDEAALEPDDYDIQGFMPGGYLADPRLSSFAHWSEVPWELSVAVCGACAYTKPIPFSLLRQVKSA